MLLLLLGSMPKGGGRGGLQHLGGESLQRRRGLRSRGSCCPNFWDVAVGVDSRSRGTYRGWRPPLRGNICLQPVQNCTPS
jgi:hypothetical protein